LKHELRGRCNATTCKPLEPFPSRAFALARFIKAEHRPEALRDERA
jgi:hypothetical protein